MEDYSRHVYALDTSMHRDPGHYHPMLNAKCDWALHAAFREPSRSVSLVGATSVRCAAQLEALVSHERLGCGVIMPDGHKLDGRVAQSALPLPSDLYGAEHREHTIRTVPLSVLCDLDGASATAQTAYLTVPSADRTTSLNSSASSHRVIIAIEDGGVAEARSHTTEAFHVCTKLYGDGGALASDEYRRAWLHHLHAAGVGCVHVYALEPLPATLHEQLNASRLVRLVQWGHVRYPPEDLRAQREYAAEIESHMLTSPGPTYTPALSPHTITSPEPTYSPPALGPYAHVAGTPPRSSRDSWRP